MVPRSTRPPERMSNNVCARDVMQAPETPGETRSPPVPPLPASECPRLTLDSELPNLRELSIGITCIEWALLAEDGVCVPPDPAEGGVFRCTRPERAPLCCIGVWGELRLLAALWFGAPCEPLSDAL